MIGHDPWGRETDDPLPDAIKAYRDSLDAFERTDEESLPDEYKAREGEYHRKLDVIATWDRPTLTCEGAAEALRFAQDERKDGDDHWTVDTMIAAALSYLEIEKSIHNGRAMCLHQGRKAACSISAQSPAVAITN